MNSGYTYRGRKNTSRPSVRSRIDYFLISEDLYDYISEASTVEDELASTDHKMIYVSLRFNQFSQVPEPTSTR